MTVSRVLPSRPVVELGAYLGAGGGRALEAARRLGPEAVIEDVRASGLRGRGGAGFPAGRKWATVRERRSPTRPATVVVNGAEGEPGSFKDRALLRSNPYAVVEGAIVAAHCIDADRVVVAVRGSCVLEQRILDDVVRAVRDAGWTEGITLEVFAGPEEYLFGEETGLLEAIDGRPPFPRLQPPYRLGADEVMEHPDGVPELATPGGTTDAPPTLVNNAETLAHVAGIVAEGPQWFRALGTDPSPGTIVCTVSGDTARAGVGEFPMGTPLRDILDELGDGMPDGRGVAAVMSGVANPLVAAGHLDTPASHEDLRAIGSGLGAAGFLVFDDHTDFAAVAEGVSRFLAVESCGQCTPCKQDGLVIAELLRRVDADEGDGLVLLELDAHLRDVADSARCALAEQHQRVVTDLRTRFATQWSEHLCDVRPPVEPVLITLIDDIVDGRAVLDTRHARKQPDWTYDDVDSGEAPADRYGEGRPAQYPPPVPDAIGV